MLQPIGSHARYIQSVLRGTSREDSAATPEYVKRCWLRCLPNFGGLMPRASRGCNFICADYRRSA